MKRRIVRHILVWAFGTGVAIYLFGSNGPFVKYLHVDTSFLVFPLVGFLMIRFVAKLTFTLASARERSDEGEAIYHLLYGTAWGFLLYCIFDRANNFYVAFVDAFPHYSGINEVIPYLPAIKSLNVLMVVLVFGITIYRLSASFERLQPKWKLRPAGEALAFLIAGYAIWRMIREFEQFWQPLSRIAWIPFASFTLIAVAMVCAYGENNKKGLASDACRWLRGAIGKIIVISILLGLYLAVIRPEFMNNYRYAHLIDWGLVIMVAWYAYLNARSGLGAKYTLPLVLESWRKHMQEIEDRTGRELEQLTTLQKRFVEDSARGPLLVHLMLLLGDNDWSEDRALSLLQPLIDHRDIKPPWYAFRWKRRRIIRKNQENRRQLVDQIISSLKPETVSRTKTGYRRAR